MVEYPLPKDDVSAVLLRKEDLDTARVQLKRTRAQPQYKVTYPSDVRVILRDLEDMDREYVKVLHLDTKNQVIGIETIAIGDMSSAIVNAREAVKGALLMSSRGAIIAHNHPSGDPTPSSEDKALAQKLVNAYNMINVTLYDMIIVGRDTLYSFNDRNIMPRPQELCSTGERVMETENMKTDACNAAIRAVMETLREYCGEPGVMDLEGMRIVVPREVYTVREDSGLTIEQKISSVKGTSWAQNLTKNWLAKMLPYLVVGTDEYKRAYDTMIEKVSRGLVT